MVFFVQKPGKVATWAVTGEKEMNVIEEPRSDPLL